jgi:hypothetical protein
MVTTTTPTARTMSMIRAAVTERAPATGSIRVVRERGTPST